MTLSGPEVCQLDSRITLTVLLLSLTPNINIKVSRYDLCILSGSLTRLSGNRITHNTARPSTCFYAFPHSRKLVSSFFKGGRNNISLHGGNSIKQTFYDPNCICRASGRWNQEGWQMVKTSNHGDLWSLAEHHRDTSCSNNNEIFNTLWFHLVPHIWVVFRSNSI